MGASAASTLWFCQANIGFGSIRVFKAKAAGLAGIQFHIRSQLQGAHPGNISAFDPDDYIAGLHSSGVRERPLRNLRYDDFRDDGIEEKALALDVDRETKFLLRGMADGCQDQEEEEG